MSIVIRIEPEEPAVCVPCVWVGALLYVGCFWGVVAYAIWSWL
jgi:hypothetical protein